jgi:hypothetical protein
MEQWAFGISRSSGMVPLSLNRFPFSCFILRGTRIEYIVIEIEKLHKIIHLTKRHDQCQEKNYFKKIYFVVTYCVKGCLGAPQQVNQRGNIELLFKAVFLRRIPQRAEQL